MDRVKQSREAAALANEGRKKRTRRRYPQELRLLAARHCHQERRRGRTYTETAEELGVHSSTLAMWFQALPEAQAATSHESWRPLHFGDRPARSQGPTH